MNPQLSNGGRARGSFTANSRSPRATSRGPRGDRASGSGARRSSAQRDVAQDLAKQLLRELLERPSILVERVPEVDVGESDDAEPSSD